MRIALAGAFALCLAAPAFAGNDALSFILQDAARMAETEASVEPVALPADPAAAATTTPESGASVPTGSVAAIVVERARAHGIDPSLALAIAKVESNFRCNAVGRSGELGVMQVKPATARSVGVTGNLRDCKTGIEAGLLYLREAIARHGEGCGAISAYNMGIHRNSAPCTGYGRKVMATMANVQTASLR
ncbi:lytic transglycosylase domain-containing protein [Salinarimonas sp.]|uniref:lytic transglycosylase domain-containing protein n=1 Tax=Salinarimonas sp. TaxID=2766526 RepID=UPI00391BEB8D